MRTVYTRDIQVVHVPRGIRVGCRSRRRRQRKKLSKRWGVFHHRDLGRVSVHLLKDCYPTAVEFDPRRQEIAMGVDLATDPSKDLSVTVTLERKAESDEDLLRWFDEALRNGR